jgi:hypothetical protein
MTFLFLILWAGLAFLYLTRRRFVAIVYLLALPLFPFYWTPVSFPILPDLSVQRVVAVGIMLGIVMEALVDLRERRLDMRRLPLDLAVLAMMVIWSLSAFEVSLSQGLRRILLNLMDFWVPYGLVLRLAVSAKEIKSWLKWIAWPALGIAILTVYEYVTQAPVAWEWFLKLAPVGSVGELWSPSFRTELLRVQATFGQPIFLGFYLVFAGLAALTLGSLSSGAKRLWAYLASACLMLVSILPMARGSAIALFVGLSLMLAFGGGGVRWGFLAAFSGAFVLLWLNAGYFEGINSYWSDFILTLVGRAPANVQVAQLANWIGRQDVLDAGLNIIVIGPLFGYGGYGNPAIPETWIISDVVIAFIQVGLVSGVVGFATFIAFLGFVAARALQNWHRERQTVNASLATGLLAGLVIVLFSWAGSSWPGQFTQLGWILLGMIVGWNTSVTRVFRAADA